MRTPKPAHPRLPLNSFETKESLRSQSRQDRASTPPPPFLTLESGQVSGEQPLISVPLQGTFNQINLPGTTYLSGEQQTAVDYPLTREYQNYPLTRRSEYLRSSLKFFGLKLTHVPMPPLSRAKVTRTPYSWVCSVKTFA